MVNFVQAFCFQLIHAVQMDKYACSSKLESKSPILFSECSFLRRPGRLSAIQHVSTLKLWSRQQWDEGCFSIGGFSAKLSISVYAVVCYICHLQAALHGGDGSEQSCGFGGSLRQGGGDMKAEINEVSGTALLPRHCPEAAVCGRPTLIIWGSQCSTYTRPAVIWTPAASSVRRVWLCSPRNDTSRHNVSFISFLPKCA